MSLVRWCVKIEVAVDSQRLASAVGFFAVSATVFGCVDQLTRSLKAQEPADFQPLSLNGSDCY